MRKLVTNCGSCEANIMLWQDCEYFARGLGCWFCGIGSVDKLKDKNNLVTARKISMLNKSERKKWWDQNKNKVIENIIESLDYAIKNDYSDHCHYIFISGNASNDALDFQWKMYYDVMNSVNNIVDLSKVDSSIILMPPQDFRWIDKIYETGVQKVGFNLEVWNHELFRKYCPGKASYGRKKIIDALKYAVNLFGEGNVWTTFVFGIESPKSTLKGIKEMASLGVVGGSNVFHKDHGTRLIDHSIPLTNDIISFSNKVSEVYKNNGFLPFYCEKATRSNLLNEAYKGWCK